MSGIGLAEIIVTPLPFGTGSNPSSTNTENGFVNLSSDGAVGNTDGHCSDAVTEQADPVTEGEAVDQSHQAGTGYESFIVSFTDGAEVTKIVCGTNVAGLVSAQLTNAVGTAAAGAEGEAKVQYAGQTVTSSDEQTVAIVAGKPSSIGITVGSELVVFGFNMSFTLAGTAASTAPVGDNDTGTPGAAGDVTISYDRKVVAEYLCELGSAATTAEVCTAAWIQNVTP